MRKPGAAATGEDVVEGMRAAAGVRVSRFRCMDSRRGPLGMVPHRAPGGLSGAFGWYESSPKFFRPYQSLGGSATPYKLTSVAMPALMSHDFS